MSDTIDYEALDKAIQEAQRQTKQTNTKKPHTSTASVQVKTPSKPSVKAPVSAAEKTPSRPRPIRGRFMDIASPVRPRQAPTAPKSTSIPVKTSTPAAHAPRSTATQAPIAPQTTAHSLPKYHHAPIQNTTSPQAAAQIHNRRLLERKRQLLEQQRRQELIKRRQLAQKQAELHAREQAELERHSRQALERNPLQNSPSREATAQAAIDDFIDSPEESSYNIGVRSPLFVNTNVEKRPLGADYTDSSADRIESTKNVYSQKDPSKIQKSKKDQKHTVVESPKKTSGWLWTLLALFIIAAGGALGYFAYIMVFANQF